jgi:hypothetical protein
VRRHHCAPALLVIVSTFALPGPAGGQVAVCPPATGLTVQQWTDSWCWAANMEFLARAFVCDEFQCKFAEDLYRRKSYAQVVAFYEAFNPQ